MTLPDLKPLPQTRTVSPVFILTLRVTEAMQLLKVPRPQNNTLQHYARGTGAGEEAGAASGLHAARDTPPSRAFPSRMFLSLPWGTPLDKSAQVLIMGVGQGFPRASFSLLNSRENHFPCLLSSERLTNIPAARLRSLQNLEGGFRGQLQPPVTCDRPKTPVLAWSHPGAGSLGTDTATLPESRCFSRPGWLLC